MEMLLGIFIVVFVVACLMPDEQLSQDFFRLLAEILRLLIVGPFYALALVLAATYWLFSELLDLIAAGARWAGPHLWRALWLGVTFAVLLVQEWWRGPPLDQDEEDDGGEEDGASSSGPDAYEQALRVLGLTPGFTREALRHAYRRAMRAAHPDAGGSHVRAQEINAAHDVLRQAHGWR